MAKKRKKKGLHHNLLKKHPAYAAWHRHPAHQVMHWVVFMFAVAATASVLVSQVKASF